MSKTTKKNVFNQKVDKVVEEKLPEIKTEIFEEPKFEFQKDYFIGGNGGDAVIDELPTEESVNVEEALQITADLTNNFIPKIKEIKPDKYKAHTQSEIPVEVPKIMRLHDEIKEKTNRTIGSLNREELNQFYKTGILPK